MKIILKNNLAEYDMNTKEYLDLIDLLHKWYGCPYTLDSIEASIYSMWHMIFFGKFFVK